MAAGAAVMEAVQFRITDGVLEYRCLLIRERDLYRDNEPCGEELWLKYKHEYSEWMPVPTVPTSEGKN